MSPFMWLVTCRVIKNKSIKSNLFAVICFQSDALKCYVTLGERELLKDVSDKLLKQLIVNCNETAQQSQSI